MTLRPVAIKVAGGSFAWSDLGAQIAGIDRGTRSPGGESAIKCPSPLNMLKDTYDHTGICY